MPTSAARIPKNPIAEQIDATSKLGAVPGPDQTLEAIAAERLPAPDAPELRNLTLRDLLG